MKKSFRDRFDSWFYSPARPYEFWKPQSGLIGGLIGALIISTLALVALF